MHGIGEIRRMNRNPHGANVDARLEAYRVQYDIMRRALVAIRDGKTLDKGGPQVAAMVALDMVDRHRHGEAVGLDYDPGKAVAHV